MSTDPNESIDTPPYEPPLDQIPPYSSAISYYGTALLRHEFDTPFSATSSSSANLKPVILELNSNQLNIYDFADKSVCASLEAVFAHQNFFEDSNKAEPRLPENDYALDGDAYGDAGADNTISIVSKLRSKFASHKMEKRLSDLATHHNDLIDNSMLLEPTSDTAVYEKFSRKYRGKLIHSLTLQNLQLGEAPSTSSATYRGSGRCKGCSSLIKYRNSLRLRVEYRQMTVFLWSFFAMVHWFRNLSIGRDLAYSLDTRVVSRMKSIPRHFTAFNNAMLTAAANEALLALPSSAETVDVKRSWEMAGGEESGYNSDASSVMSGIPRRDSSSTAVTTATEASKTEENQYVMINGIRIVCFEDYYKPSEKQYISNCIPLLNSYDKWTGTKLTVLNVEYMLPKSDSQSDSEDMVFILPMNFCNLVKSYSKQFSNQQVAMTNNCRDFYVDERGLVSV